MIQTRGLTFAYPGQLPLFEGLDWQVGGDESWCVIGPSGCGKSTLLYLLAGLRHPTAGEIRVGGQKLTRPRPQTGLILQDYGLLPWATVAENAALGLRVRRFYGPDGRHAPSGQNLRRTEIAERAGFWLERLGIAALRNQVPGPDLGRAAPAHGHRPHPGPQPGSAAHGRALFLAGCPHP
ncbi:MAG: ATP-binding cassette domain-containing protein [Chloroflexi bacterium]|nr:MAG: ATP-binding cassette domain-containing protein [Chloroflexota bacterium]